MLRQSLHSRFLKHSRHSGGLAFCAVVMTCALIVLVRFCIADLQIDWDEELYFQIAKYWSADTLPYRDLFDHKPPLLYLHYKVLTFNGSSMVALRSLQVIFLLLSLIGLYRCLARQIHVFFIPAVLAFLSLPGVIGTNLEIIYLPYLLLLVVCLLCHQFVWAALLAAVVVSLKYTVCLDILGIVLFVWLCGRCQKRSLLRFFFVASILFFVINLSFYSYFKRHGVDLLEATVLQNLAHSSHKRTLLPDIQFLVVSLYIVLCIGLIKWLPVLATDAKAVDSKHSTGFIWGLCLWTILAFIQASITGKAYFHYYIPIFVPLTLLLSYQLQQASVVWGNRFIVMNCLALCAVVCLTGWLHYQKNRSDRARLLPYCKLKPFHYHGHNLSIYRKCQVKPLKYVFTAFYTDPHFIKVSQSGGLDWLLTVDRAVVAEQDEKISLFKNGAAFRESLISKN